MLFRSSVGSPAPAIKVAKWIKGSEVKGFEKGKTYVVEFWATWCGPCRKAIPHVIELAKQYKDKVTFVGVSVWENDETYLDSVQKFVDKMGEKMEYNVAADDKFGNEGTMARTWMQAAPAQGGRAEQVFEGVQPSGPHCALSLARIARAAIPALCNEVT